MAGISTNINQFADTFSNIQVNQLPVNLRNDFGRINSQFAQLRNSLRDSANKIDQAQLRSQVESLRSDLNQLSSQVQDPAIRQQIDGVRDQLAGLDLSGTAQDAANSIRSGSVVPNASGSAQGSANNATQATIDGSRNATGAAANSATEAAGQATGRIQSDTPTTPTPSTNPNP